MTTSVACKTLHVTPPSGQYITEQVRVIVGPNGCDQGQAVAPELNVMEMTEVEYTHLQQIIQSHMEAEAAEQDGTGEDKLNPTSCERNNCKATHTPPVCESNGSNSLAMEAHYTLPASNNNSDNDQGTADVQDVNLTLYTETTGTAHVEQRTPVRCGEVPSSVLEKLKCTVDLARDRGNHRRMPPIGSRPSPSARVCLEKRFSCGPCDLKRQQWAQTAVMNTFRSLLHRSTDMPGIAMHSQPEKLPSTERMAAVENSYDGNPLGSACGQGLSHLFELLEGSKHREVIAPKTFSSSYCSDTTADSALRSSCIVYPTDEQRAASMDHSKPLTTPLVSGKTPRHCGIGEILPPHALLLGIDEVMGKAVKPARMHGSRPLQVRDPNILQTSVYTRAACTPRRRTGPAVETNERRARHNSKERERRRRIRLCCDELKLLVPFCNPETDKATALQWTTAYLKYISEIYGDSLKQDFQNAFCGETGIRIRPSCTGDAPECESSA